MEGANGSTSKRRFGIVVNYAILLLGLLVSVIGFQTGWTTLLIVLFWVSVVLVITTFVPVHVRTGLWRLAHTGEASLDERELQHNLRALRHAYIVFSIVSLAIILAMAVIGLGDQVLQLVVFWILLYLAHTLPSAILGWTLTRVPAQLDL